MNKVILAIFAVLLLVLAGCATEHAHEEHDDHDDDHGHDDDKDHASSKNVELPENPTILTTFYPVEEITKAIVQDTATVEVLVGTGVEPHSFEPTPNQIVTLSKANIFVTMEGLFESVEKDILEASSDIVVIDAAHNLELIKGEEHDDHHDEHEEDGHEEENHEEDEHAHEDEEAHHDEDEHESHEDDHDDHDDHKEEGHDDGHDHDHGEFDPHVWLSIHNMEAMTNEIAEHLVEFYPENKELYEANAKAYIEKLEQLESEYETKLATCEHEEIIVNHKAFGYLAHEYGFEQVSVAGFSPESEPSPKTIQNVIDEAKEHGLTYVFSEGQLDKKTAETIAADIGGEVLELNPLRLNDDEDYFSIMRANLESLATGLGCQN